MKLSLFIILIIGFLTIPAKSKQHDILTVDGQYLSLKDKNEELSTEATFFEHNIRELQSGTTGGVLNITYDGLNAEAKSVITINRLTGTGSLEMQGTSTNTLKLFRLADNATADFYGNLTLSNYSAAWDGAGFYDNVTVLETGEMSMQGSISLDVAGYCATDSYFIAALGLNGDLSISGLDAAEYIASAAYVYSGHLAEHTSAIYHNFDFSDYITPEACSLTIDTGGTHHFHGSLLGGLTIIKKGSGTQSFTGNLGTENNFQALGGTLNLNSNTQSATIIIDGAALNNTGDLSAGALQMKDGTLSVSGNLKASEASFRGCNTLKAADIEGTEWVLHLQKEHQSQPSLCLSSATAGTLDKLELVYNKAEMLRGWYQLVENSSLMTFEQILSNGTAATTTMDEGKLLFYLTDGELTLPRTEVAELVWLPVSGSWKVGSGHIEGHWAGPDTNSNFLNGDKVFFRQATEVELEGELLPSAVMVSNTTGCIIFHGEGSIGGTASLAKSGTGSLRISGAHTFTGGTTLHNGELITENAKALGSGRIELKGGHLNLNHQAITNSIQVHGNAEISGGASFGGELVMQSGCLRGDTLHLARTAQLHGGDIDLQLTGNGGMQVQGDVRLCGANSYSGSTTITSGTLTTSHARSLGSSTVILSGGNLDLGHQSADNTLHIRGESQLLNSSQFNGQIDLQSGRLSTHSLGNAGLSCSGTASLHAESPLNLTRAIHNTGELNMTGSFNVTALAESINPHMVDAYGNIGGTSGFQRDSGTSISLFTGNGTLSGTARFIFRGEEVMFNAQGNWSKGAATHYGQYHIDSNHQVAVSAIRAAAGDALQIITMNGGSLTADDNADIAAEGAHILLTHGTLSGSCANSEITATGGTLSTTFSGTSSVSSTAAVKLTGSLSNTGTLTLQGEMDASALPLEEQAATRTGGTSTASGFACTASYSVQVVSGGTIHAAATIIHGDKRLSLGADGRATAGGSVDYSEYLLTGSDTARLSAIQRPELQRILVDGGIFTVDADTAALQTSGGIVVLESGSISSPLSGSTALHITGTGRLTTANTHTGGTLLNGGELTITTPEALGLAEFRSSGISTLSAEGFTMVLSAPLHNDGHLLLNGSFDVSALAESHSATMVDAYGNEGGSSGFLRDTGTKIQLITGGTLNCASANILLHGERITPDARGHASLPGALHLDTYHITGEHSISVSAIMQVAGEELQRIDMNSGTLLVDTSTQALSASGGLVQVQNAHLGGNMSGTTQVEVLGNAVLSGQNSHNGGTTIAAGSLKLAHSQALGCGAVYLGSKARISVPMLDMADLPVNNHLHLSGSSVLAGLENFTGSITMQEGAETTIATNDMLKLNKGQILTLAPGGNTIHGHVNLNGGTIVLTGEALTLNGVANFSDTLTLDLSQLENLDSEILVLDFPADFDKELISIVLPDGMQNNGLIFDPDTGRLKVETTPNNTQVPTSSQLAAKLNRNQRAAYEVLRRISPESVSGDLRKLVDNVCHASDIDDLRNLMDRVNGAGYTALVNSVADDALAQLQRLRDLAGTAHSLAPDHHTAVLMHAFNSSSSAAAQEQGYNRNAWGGQLIVEQQVDTQLCLGLSLSNGLTDITPEGDEEHSDTATHLSGYALYANQGWRFHFALGMGMHEFSLSRRLADGNIRKVEGVSGSSVNYGAAIARSFVLSSDSALQVFLALQSSTAQVDSFNESDSTASLLADEQQATLNELSLGLRYETTLAESLHLGLHTAITATFGDTASELDMHFSGAPEHEFRLKSDERESLGGRLGLSLALPISPGASIHASSDLHLQGCAHSLNSQVGIILHF